MSTFRRAVAVLALLAQTLVPKTAPGQEGFASTGGTTVSVDAPIVTITVNIDMVVAAPNKEGLKEQLDGIAQQIMAYWNDGLTELSNDCLLYDLVVVINPVAKSAARTISVDGRTAYGTTPGHHVVVWGGSEPGAPWPETYDPYDADQAANPGEDYATPYMHELWSIWSGHIETARDYAHEFGHLLGFGDDYRRSGLPIPERQGTLMDNGDRIDQRLADRLADIVKSSGQRLPECWTGTMDLSLSKDYLAEQSGLARQACTGSWRVTPSFSVAPDGTISGTAEANLTSGPDCTFEIPGSGTTAEFNIGGTASAGVLELQFTMTRVEPPAGWLGLSAAMREPHRVARVSPTHAEGTMPIAAVDAGSFPVTGSTTLNLDCSTCSNEP